MVHGELWRLADPEATLAELDDYEGTAYSRILVNDAWIYLYNGSVSSDAYEFSRGISSFHEILIASTS